MSRDRLYALLPAALRQRDAEAGAPLAALLGLIGDQLLHLREDLQQLHDDQFIETCADWLVPYIGDLVAHEPRHGILPRIASPRAEVARTVAYRRRKGTAAVLQQLAQDVTGWPARVREVFRDLATTQHLNFARPEHTHTPDLRRARDLLAIDTPFATVPVRPDVRDAAHRDLPDVVTFVWRLRAFPLQRVTPAQVAENDFTRFTFSPLGDPVPLFSRPGDSEQAGARDDLADVPGPIGRRELHDRLALYYGEDRSLWVRVDGELIPRERIDAADLSDDPDDPARWHRGARPVAADAPVRVAVDPVLGRLAISARSSPVAHRVEVGFHVGAPAELGGGQYERDSLGPDALPATVVRRASDGRDLELDLKDLLADLAGERVLEIVDSATHRTAIGGLGIPGGARLTIRAADRERPLLLLERDLELLADTTNGDAGAELVLDGLVIAGGALVVAAGCRLRSLTLRHCTLVPGLLRTADGRPDPTHLGAASLVVHAPDLQVTLRDCITGPIRSVDAASVRLVRSVVDAGPGGLAYAAPDDGAGGPLDLDVCTVIGDVRALSIGLASNSIFHGEVTSERRQSGCVRFCNLPLRSQVPRRFRCQPDADRPLVAEFTTLRYGAPAYAQLSRRTPPELRGGADDESELGVYHDLFQPHLEGNLRARLDEFLRVGLRAGVVFVT